MPVRSEKPLTEKWIDRCPFCNHTDKARIKPSGDFYCAHCKQMFYNEEHPDLDKRSRWMERNMPYDPRNFPRINND